VPALAALQLSFVPPRRSSLQLLLEAPYTSALEHFEVRPVFVTTIPAKSWRAGTVLSANKDFRFCFQHYEFK
jgi:hypothetical protein